MGEGRGKSAESDPVLGGVNSTSRGSGILVFRAQKGDFYHHSFGDWVIGSDFWVFRVVCLCPSNSV